MSTTTTTTASANTTTTTTTTVNPEQATAFAALVLADDNLAITPEKLQALLKAAGITEVEPIWTTLFANALKDKDVKDILTAVAASGPEAGGDTAPHPPECDGHNNGESGPDGVDSGLDSESDEGVGYLLFD